MSVTTGSTFNHIVEYGEPWANKFIEIVNSQESEVQSAWRDLVSLYKSSSSAKPSKKWFSTSQGLIDIIGRATYQKVLIQIFELAILDRTHVLKSEEYYERYYKHPDEPYEGNWTLREYQESIHGHIDISYTYSNSNTLVLKSLMWSAGEFSDSELAVKLRNCTYALCKKIPLHGMRSQKLASAGAYGLVLMKEDIGLKELIVLRSLIRYPVAIKVLDKHLAQAAKERNITTEDLSELVTPDYGMSEVGELREVMGATTAIAKASNDGKVELSWVDGDKSQKSPPASIKVEFKEEIKEFKAASKEIEVAISAHALRIESLYLFDRSINYEEWLDRYAHHPLIAVLARRLIWMFEFKTETKSAIYSSDGFVDSSNNEVKINESIKVSLWHPIESSVEEIVAWRHWLIENQINQPFKQAHREIYVLTDKERELSDHSERFANHILKHSQFHALASNRLWKQVRGGGWDAGNENDAVRFIKALDVEARFQATGLQSYGFSNTQIYQAVGTNKLSFFKDQAVVPLETIPRIVFSEILRDIDLFVSVCSVGNDPDWQDRKSEYWRSSSFGELNESAKVRKEVLTAILPSFKNASRMTMEKNTLIIEGKLNHYKIHLGSSNVMLLPDNKFLSITGATNKNNVLLPFNGDSILSNIISKALFLLDDHKIKDEKILSQLKN